MMYTTGGKLATVIFPLLLTAPQASSAGMLTSAAAGNAAAGRGASGSTGPARPRPAGPPGSQPTHSFASLPPPQALSVVLTHSPLTTPWMRIVFGNLMAKPAPEEMPNMYLGFLSSPYFLVHPSMAALASRWSSAGRQAGGQVGQAGGPAREVGWRAGRRTSSARVGCPTIESLAGHWCCCRHRRLPRLTLVRVSRAAEASVLVLTVLGGQRQHGIAAGQTCLGVGHLFRQACRAGQKWGGRSIDSHT
jgi:hypothetical protein